MKTDCTTCKYGYEDERLGIPMCHHPLRFSKDCVDFNMHEEKESKESEKSISKDLEEAASEFANQDCVTFISRKKGFIAGVEWQKEQDLAEMAQSKSPLSVAYANRCFENGKQAMKEQMLKEAVEGTVHHVMNCHYIITDQKALNARLRGFPEGTVVNIFICKAEEE